MTVLPARTGAELSAAFERAGPGCRLIAFTTPVIVPGALLRQLDFPAYNVHPGPPTYPGTQPESFAVYEGASRFGATLHEMVARVDEGPIAAVTWFDVTPGTARMALAQLAYEAAVKLFADYAPRIATATQPLPHIGEAWQGPKRRKADFEAMCRLPPDIGRQELERRYLAFGQGPQNQLFTELHGRRFQMEKVWVEEG